MIEILQGVRPGESRLLDEAMRLRHQVFVEEKGWTKLRQDDGRERDSFDTLATVHQIAVVSGQVAGYQRLNPTTGPHLLSDVHPHMCVKPYSRAPHVWEWSRYCVARKYRQDKTFCDVASTLLIAAVEWAEINGVRQIVLEFHPVWITRFLELGFQVVPLGLPEEFDGEPTVAAQLSFDDRTLQSMRSARGIAEPVFSADQRIAMSMRLAS
jgi:acyl-homoserine lactone synthase